MEARSRWAIGILAALVVGLAVGLIIVAGDNSKEPSTVTVQPTTEHTQSTESTNTGSTPTPTPTNGGTPAPSPGGTGGSGL